ncbi:MAG: hypothetical protein V4510_08835 [bacterium]
MRAILAVILFAFAALAGCTSSSVPETTSSPVVCSSARVGDGTAALSSWDTAPTAANPQPKSVTRLEFVARLNDSAGVPWPTGSGNQVAGDYVFGSALNHVFFIADVHDPMHPVLVFNSTGREGKTEYARKADLMPHPDGTRTLILATGRNHFGMQFWNVTDPRQPVWLSNVELEGVNNHNLAVVPGTEYVFNAPSSGMGNGNELIDARDPCHPVVVGKFGIYGCHGITFHGTLGQPKFRAYCAGVQATEIWSLDGFDPAKPNFGITVLATVDKTANPLIGTRGLHHYAGSNAAGTVLIIGDEYSGGGQPGACFAYEPTTGLATPLGALWFYDVANEASPVLKGWISPPTMRPQDEPVPQVPTEPDETPGAGCTAHFGTLVPGEEKFVIAWYNAGVLLIDFTEPSHPAILSQYRAPGINTWNARVWNGYVFTGDIGRGMDVLKLA